MGRWAVVHFVWRLPFARRREIYPDLLRDLSTGYRVVVNEYKDVYGVRKYRGVGLFEI